MTGIRKFYLNEVNIMQPLLKCAIAGIIEVIIIGTLFWSADSRVSLSHAPTFTLSDAIFWTFISILGVGLAAYFIARSANRGD